MKLRWLIGLMLIGLLLAACAHQFSGVAPNPIGPAPDFALTDENGQPFKLSDLRGKWILLAYGYTHCPDVCPLTLSHLRDVKKIVDPNGDQVQVVFVTIDPERDTPDIMQQVCGPLRSTLPAEIQRAERHAGRDRGGGATLQREVREERNRIGGRLQHGAHRRSVSDRSAVQLADDVSVWRQG